MTGGPVPGGRRVAVIDGCRTPFCRAGTLFNNTSAVDLARHAAVELIERNGLTGREVDPPGAPRVRESSFARR
jgi:hypothetical protein